MAPEFKAIAWSLGLGLLVGLQRERAASPLAGFRTFPLVTALGTVCAWLARAGGGWIVGGGLLALAACVKGLTWHPRLLALAEMASVFAFRFVESPVVD